MSEYIPIAEWERKMFKKLVEQSKKERGFLKEITDLYPNREDFVMMGYIHSFP